MSRSTTPISALYRTLAIMATAIAAAVGHGQVHMFGGNPQHTQQYPPAQRMNRIKWSALINENASGGFAHYGAPLVTVNNTVIIMVRTLTNGYDLLALDALTGATKYRIATDYVSPAASWLIPVQPVITTGSFGTRLYYPGSGGTIWRLDNPDNPIPGTPVRMVFYGTETDYLNDQAAWDAALYVNTPIVADSAGNVFFGTRAAGTSPAPLNTTQSFVVRFDAVTGAATYTDCFSATGVAGVSRVTHGSAFAFSNNEQTIYMAMKGTLSTMEPHLVALDATSLAPVGKVKLKDPRNGNNTSVPDISTASPLVAPDGDVYYGTASNPGNGSRGFLLHFDSTLTQTKTPGGFGWDYTPSVVPTSMFPYYSGSSSYLLFCKYNEYDTGLHRVVLLDPASTQVDYHANANNLVEMRQYASVLSPTPDSPSNIILGWGREWCINASAVSVYDKSVYFNCEDGFLYRWHFPTNSLKEAVQLNAGIGQPYVPTVIGPDGTLFTLNGGYIFAIGGLDDISMTLESSSPNVAYTVDGDSITFTAKVTGTSNIPTGSILFEDTTQTYAGTTTVTLGTVALDANGEAQLTTSLLTSGGIVTGTHLGNHRIKATYSGDSLYGTGSAQLNQKVHADLSITTLTIGGTLTTAGPTTLTASLSPVGTGSFPTGYVTFRDSWNVLGQVHVDASGVATISVTGLPAGYHYFYADYAGDTFFTASGDNKNAWIQDKPVAVTDKYYTNDGDPTLIINAPGVLSNDLNSPTSATLMTSPQHSSSFAFNANGSFYYKPAAGWIGTDYFKYKAVNSLGNSPTVICYVITRPVLVAVHHNATQYTGGAPVTGTVELKSNAPAGGVKVFLSDASPYLSANGLFVTVSQGSKTALYSVPSSVVSSPIKVKVSGEIQIGPPTPKVDSIGCWLMPKAKAVNDAYSVNGNTTLQVTGAGVLANDGYVLGGSALLMTSPSHAAAFSLNGNGTFNYTPVVGYIGSDLFTYKIQNSAGTSNTATVLINVRAVIVSMVVNNPTQGGQLYVGKVTICGNAPVGGVKVYFTDTLGELLSETYVLTIPFGSSDAMFSIPTTAVATTLYGKLQSKLNNGSGSANIKNVVLTP